MRLRATLALALGLLLLATSSTAHAAVDRGGAVRIATSNPRVAEVMARYGGGNANVDRQGGDWVVTLGAKGHVRALVVIDAFDGRITQLYTGVKAEFPLARGKGSGVVQRKLNAVWIWIPLCLIFVLAFFDRRRPGRLLHLDLAAVALFSVSYAFFMTGRLSASVPLSYPPLVYLLVRMLVAGWRPQARPGPLTWMPLKAVVYLTLTLLTARVALILLNPFVLDVGYASSAGAHRVLHGLELYTRGGDHLDTYGPLNYIAYIPFILIWPFNASQATPHAAQAAAIFFDLATVAGLLVLGRQLRDRALGWALALAWAACPFTALSLACASNDALVSALVVWALVALRSGAATGLLTGAAAAAKFTPALLLPLLATPLGKLSWKRVAIVFGCAALVVVGTLLPVMPAGGLREFYDTTIGFQLHRQSPFSIWTQHPSLHALQSALKIGALLLAAAVALGSAQRRNVGQVAALAAAVIVAEQIPLQHWFYLYLVWVIPLYCVALFSEHAAGGRSAASRP